MVYLSFFINIQLRRYTEIQSVIDKTYPASLKIFLISISFKKTADWFGNYLICVSLQSEFE